MYLLSTDLRGCSNTDTLKITIDTTFFVLSISQNLISPNNNDGINDNFIISNIGDFIGTNYRVEIKLYDEKDLLIFENNDLKKVYDQNQQIIVWNGLGNVAGSNQVLNTGPYFYIIKIFVKEGANENLKYLQTGSIMLLNNK